MPAHAGDPGRMISAPRGAQLPRALLTLYGLGPRPGVGLELKFYGYSLLPCTTAASTLPILDHKSFAVARSP